MKKLLLTGSIFLFACGFVGSVSAAGSQTKSTSTHTTTPKTTTTPKAKSLPSSTVRPSGPASSSTAARTQKELAQTENQKAYAGKSKSQSVAAKEQPTSRSSDSRPIQFGYKAPKGDTSVRPAPSKNSPHSSVHVASHQR